MSVALALTAFAVVIYGARFSIAAWVESRAAANGWPEGLGLLAGLACGELIFPGPMPWYLGACAHDAPVLLQVADLSGPITVSTVLAAGGLHLYEVARLVMAGNRADRRKSGALALAWMFLISAAVVYGLYRLAESRGQPGQPGQLRVGIVQANIPPDATRNENTGIKAVQTQTLATWTLRDRGVDLVLWGETAVAVAVPAARVRELYPHLFTSDLGVPVLMGAALTSDDSTRFYNSAVVTDERGIVTGVYRKRQLAPFSESVPGGKRLPALARLFPHARELPGPNAESQLAIAGHSVSAFICFELLFPDLVRESVERDSADVIAGLANDAWFGDTWEPWMHFAATKLRAVENRRYLLRAAGSGISGVVDPWGRTQTSSAPMSRDALVSTIAWGTGSTMYQRVGDAPWWVASAGAAWISLRRNRRDRRMAGEARC